jgi:hypothetical protein
VNVTRLTRGVENPLDASWVASRTFRLLVARAMTLDKCRGEYDTEKTCSRANAAEGTTRARLNCNIVLRSAPIRLIVQVTAQCANARFDQVGPMLVTAPDVNPRRNDLLTEVPCGNIAETWKAKR